MKEPVNMGIIGNLVYGYCPDCGHSVTVGQKLCEHCFLLLDWSNRPLTFAEKLEKLNGK